MMNQATSHLEAWSKLINIKISNYHKQPRIGIAVIFEWRTSIQQTQMSRWIKKKLRRVWITNKGIIWQWIIKERGLYFKPNKGACISSNPKTLNICFQIFQKDPHWNPIRFWWIRVHKERILKLW